MKIYSGKATKMKNNPIRICYITGSFPPMKDGVGDWAFHIAGILKKEVELFLVIPKLDLNFGINRSNILFSNFSFLGLKNILGFIKDNSLNIIHIEYPSVFFRRRLMINFLPLIIKLIYPKKRIVLTVHEYSNYTIKGKLRIILMVLFADRIFVTDKKNSFLLKRFNKNIAGVLSVPPQIKIQPKIDYYQKNDYLTFGYWGFVRPNKGLDILLKSFQQYLNKNYKAKLFILASLDKNDKYQKHIMDLIDRLNIKDFVEIRGYLPQEELSRYLRKLDCCVLPFTDGVSDRRGTFSTAMKIGLPVITTKIDDNFIPSGLVHRKNVILSYPNETEILEAMQLMNDENVRKSIGKKAVVWAKNLSWKRIESQILRIYNKSQTE